MLHTVLELTASLLQSLAYYWHVTLLTAVMLILLVMTAGYMDEMLWTN